MRVFGDSGEVPPKALFIHVLRSLVMEGAADETFDPQEAAATLRPHFSHALERARHVRN